MKKFITIISITVLLTGIFFCAKFSSAQEVDKSEIELIVLQLRSKEEKVRFKGFKKIITIGKGGFQIKKPYRNIPEIKNAMFDVFVYYSSNPKSNRILCGDGSTYECLLGVIGDFNDIRTLPYLLENMSAGSTLMSLAKLGKPVLEAVLEKLENGGRPQKRGAADVLGLMVKEKEKDYTAQGKDREKIKQALLRSLEDKDNGRIHVVHALRKFKDKDLLPIFEKLAKEDTQVLERKDRSGKIIKRYPVREAAKKAIEKLNQSK